MSTISETQKKPISSSSVREKHKEFLFPSVTNYYKDPVVLESGKGMYLKDADGKRYLDFFGGILTVSVGHANDKVNAAVKAQVDRLGHVSTLYPTLPIVELAETLARLTPGRLQKSFFRSPARKPRRRSTAQVYTGRLESSRSATVLGPLPPRSPSRRTRPGAPCPRRSPTKHAPAPYCYRCPLKLTYPSCGVACAKDLEELIRTTTTGQVAGFLAEPIQGVGGFVTPPKEYFEIAVGIVRKFGGVFICDEVQTGFGRTGGHWFGISHWNVEPEIMTMAKGVANGMPLGVTVATPEVADSFKAATISTFGGNPVSSAAANATLAFMEEIDAPKRCAEMGAHLRAGLDGLKKKYPKTVGDVRGMGLMQGIELVADETSRTARRRPRRPSGSSRRRKRGGS